jgi:chemotaxis regulatin CheY-phosphate phosphatase CheZ
MFENRETITHDCKQFFEELDPNQQAEMSAQLFLEYCVYQDQCENTRRLAPLINTVAEALSKNIEGQDSLKVGIKAVQMYLRTPPVEYFGETLVRLRFLAQQTIDEMLRIQPKDKIFGTFLMDEGVITQEQRDIAMMAQKRLFTIQEVHARILNPTLKDDETDVVKSLKGVFQHFLISTAELEDELKESKPENIHDILQRLEDIISETEKETHFVLGIVDKIFDLEKEMKGHLMDMRNAASASKELAVHIERIFGKLNMLNSLNLELNGSQQFQDRIGQQLLKIIPAIRTFHDQLLRIAQILRLNVKNAESDQADLIKVGYGGSESVERVEQQDVDDLLSSLGL